MHQKIGLSAEQKLRRQELLRQLIDQDIQANEINSAHPLIGDRVGSHSELFALADKVHEEGDTRGYSFSLEHISRNQEGWGYLIIMTTGEEITSVDFLYPDW